MQRKAFATLIVSWLLVLSLSLNALASSSSLALDPAVPWFSQDGATPLSDDEMDEISGEVNPLVAGAVAGAVTAAFNYATSPGEKSLTGLAKSVGVGALVGAAGGAATAAYKLATTGKAAMTLAETAWSTWTGANTGALSGALEHLTKK